MGLSRFPVLWFFLLAYAITAAGSLAHLLAMQGRAPSTNWIPHVVSAGPSIAALVLTLALYGLPGVRRLVMQLAPWSVGRAWPVLIACLALPLGVVVLMVGVLALFGVSVPPPNWGGWPNYLFAAAVTEGFLGAGLFEEVGWRGFALPHLQRRYSALTSSLLIGVVWAFWHFPEFFIFAPSIPWSYLAAFVPAVLVMSIIFTWVYNTTGGSLFAAVLMHGAIDASWGYVKRDLFAGIETGGSPREDWIAGAIFGIVAVGLVLRYGATNLAPRNRVSEQQLGGETGRPPHTG